MCPKEITKTICNHSWTKYTQQVTVRSRYSGLLQLGNSQCYKGLLKRYNVPTHHVRPHDRPLWEITVAWLLARGSRAVHNLKIKRAIYERWRTVALALHRHAWDHWGAKGLEMYEGTTQGVSKVRCMKAQCKKHNCTFREVLTTPKAKTYADCRRILSFALA